MNSTRMILLALGAVLAACSEPTGSAPPPESPPPPVSEGDLYDRLTKDRQMIEVLRTAGSDLAKPHALEHHFVCPDRPSAERLAARGAEDGYEASSVFENEAEGETTFHVDLVRAVVPSLENVTAETTAMLRLAARTGADYDGWGCEVVK
jgi:regulator of RNase E activity RraB